MNEDQASTDPIQRPSAPTRSADQDTKPDGPMGDSPEEVRAEIVRTRSEMTETLNAIQERLDPERIKHQVKESVRDATIGKAEQVMSRANTTVRHMSTSVLGTIRQNPLPAAIVGLGLFCLVIWLVKSRSDHAYRVGQSHA